MPQVQTISNLLPSGGAGLQIPLDVKQRMLADQLAMENAAAPKAPYTSRAAGLVSALTGGLGGIMEGVEANRVMQGNQAAAAHAVALAQALQQPGAGQSAPAAPANGNQASPATPTSAPVSGDARDLAIRTIYGEAGGEPAQGQAGVASVLKNRLASGQYGNDMSSVITAPKQFSLWNQGDPAGDTARKLDPNSPSYQKIGSIYDGVMSGQIADPTGGATHYYNPHSASPAWGPQLAKQNDVTIGNHRFVGTGSPGPGAVAGNPASGQQASADPSPAQPGGDLRSTLMAAAAEHGGLDPDAPAPGAIPTGAAGLPPDVTPDMISAAPQTAAGQLAATSGSTVAPNGLTNADPDISQSTPGPNAQGPDTSLRDALLAAQAQHDPSAAAAPSMLSGQADPGAGNVLPADAPLPPQNPQSPYGGPPQPMTPPSVAGSNLQGAAPLSPNGGALSAMGPNGLDPSFVSPSMAAGVSSGLSAAPLSTDNLPGMDSFNAAGGVQQSSLGAAGFTGRDNASDPATAATQGGLPAPQSYVGGDLGLGTPSTFTPDPAVVAKFNATQQNGLPLGGSAGPTPQMLAAALQQPSNSDTSSNPQPGSGAALPSTGPMPPPGGQSIAALLRQQGAGGPDIPAPAGLAINGYLAPDPTSVTGQKTMAPSSGPDSPRVGVSSEPRSRSISTPGDADMPAAGAVQTSAPGLPASMAPQPMGLAGKSAAVDPSSPQNFQRQQALVQALQGSGGAQPPTPTPAMYAAAIQGGATAPASPAGGNGQSSAVPALQNGGQASSGLLGGLGSLFGGGQQPQPQPAAAPASGQMAALGGMSPQAMAQAQQIISDPYATPEMKNMIMQKLFPPVMPPEKLAAGEVLEGRRADGTYGEVARNAPKPEWTDGGNGTLYNKLDPTQTMATPGGVKGDFDMTRNGVMYNKRTGAIMAGGGDAYTQLSPAEVAAANFPAGTHVQRGPNGELSVVNPGATADASNDMTKSLTTAYTKEPGDLIQNIGTNQQKVRDLNALSGAMQRLQQNGGTTGIGTDELSHIQSAINTGANALGIGEQFDMQDKDVMRKINTQVAAASAKTMSVKGATNADFAAFQKANPGLENNPEANVRMLGMLTQDTQRDINLGQAYRDQVGQSLKNKTPIDPTMFDQIRQSYDADPKNHIVDPLTGQDISASARLPATPPTPGQNGQPLPGGMPNPPTASAQPPATAPQVAGGQNGALAQAQAAIAKGAPRAAVLQRLQSMGINPQGL